MKGKLGYLAFVVACAGLVYVAGLATARYRIPPYPLVDRAIAEVKTALAYRQERLPWQLFRYENAPKDAMVVHDAAAWNRGPTLISAFTADDTVHSVKIVDADGNTIQEWALDWSKLWPYDPPAQIPDNVMNRPQKHVHGVKLTDDGDLVFNFSELDTFRVDACGNLKWRLGRRGHHSVSEASDGSFWIPETIQHDDWVSDLPNHKPPFQEFIALHVSKDGKVIDAFSINKMLADNGYKGLLYMFTHDEFTPIVTGETLHVNDIDVFRDDMFEGIAKHGDILISMRDIHTIALVEPKSRKVKFLTTGRVMRQHDADFIDGNTISVFDNNNMLPVWFDNNSGKRGGQDQQSRVVTISLKTGEVQDVIDDAGGEPFFTDLMGIHQWLPNGNLLVAEARAGRVFERSPDGRVVWEYYNIVGDNLLGSVSMAERLDPKFDRGFFAEARSRCEGPGS